MSPLLQHVEHIIAGVHTPSIGNHPGDLQLCRQRGEQHFALAKSEDFQPLSHLAKENFIAFGAVLGRGTTRKLQKKAFIT